MEKYALSKSTFIRGLQCEKFAASHSEFFFNVHLLLFFSKMLPTVTLEMDSTLFGSNFDPFANGSIQICTSIQEPIQGPVVIALRLG